MPNRSVVFPLPLLLLVLSNLQIATANLGSQPVDPKLSLTKCDLTFTQQRRYSMFSNGKYDLGFHVMQFHVTAPTQRCYVTRNDLEQKLDVSSNDDIIGAFVFACLVPDTELVFLENKEAEELSGETGEKPTGDVSNGTQRAQYKFHSRYIQYFQTQNCRIHAKAIWMVANMTDLKVFTAVGNRAVNFGQLEHDGQLCEGFRNLVSFSILNDWTLRDYFHHLTYCTGYLNNVVEMDLSNNNLTSFPGALTTTIPNLRSLEIGRNNLTSPLQFPWKPGFAVLPRNLSRTYQFNSHYNFAGAFDMQPNLFRKMLSLDMNRITNLTNFQFSGEFQYISLERNGLREISDDVFSNVPEVEFLSLAFNELKTIPENLFASLSNLKRLDLQENMLTWLPNDTFRNLRSLKTLNLENNRLEVLQKGVFTSLPALNTLKLKNNNLMTISDEAFSTLSVQLTTLDLQHNPLKEIPPVVFLLSGLSNINLEHTDIEMIDFVKIDRRTKGSLLFELPENPIFGEILDHGIIPGLTKFLSLRYSKLRSMVIYNATKETERTFMHIIKHFTIDTEGSELACDCNIMNVTHLLQTWRAEGKLSGTEAFLAGWKCIWPDELAGRPMVDVSDDEAYCPAEEECPSACTCYLRGGVNTVTVDCRYAGLTSLPKTVPARTTELWLQNNKVQTLENRPYLHNVVLLNLTSNNIKNLPLQVLNDMNSLKGLDVKDNWLTSLDTGFADLKQLQYVRLSGNPFRCDCHTRWMKDWLLSHQSLVPDWSDIKCSTDESHGHIVATAPDDGFICTVSVSARELPVPVAVSVGVFLSVLVVVVVVVMVVVLQRRKQLSCRSSNV